MQEKKYNLADRSICKRFMVYKHAAELYSMGMNCVQELVKAFWGIVTYQLYVRASS